MKWFEWLFPNKKLVEISGLGDIARIFGTEMEVYEITYGIDKTYGNRATVTFRPRSVEYGMVKKRREECKHDKNN